MLAFLPSSHFIKAGLGKPFFQNPPIPTGSQPRPLQAMTHPQPAAARTRVLRPELHKLPGTTPLHSRRESALQAPPRAGAHADRERTGGGAEAGGAGLRVGGEEKGRGGWEGLQSARRVQLLTCCQLSSALWCWFSALADTLGDWLAQPLVPAPNPQLAPSPHRARRRSCVVRACSLEVSISRNFHHQNSPGQNTNIFGSW